MGGGAETLIEQGRAALHAGEGAEAQRAFEAALEHGESGKVLEGLAEARYLQLDYPSAIDAYERAYTAYRKERDRPAACRMARQLWFLHGGVHGDWAVGQGWLARARTLLAEAGDDTVEHGWIAFMEGTEEADLSRREASLRTAVEIARRFGEPDLEFDALAYLGECLILSGRIEEGFVLLDESLAAASSGEVQDIAALEEIYCGMLRCCEHAKDVRRADQWIRAATEVASRRNLAAISAFCRTHYGGLLTAAGRWTEAEDELTIAARLFGEGYTAMRTLAVVRLADLRVRQGKFEEAGRLLEGLDEHPDAVYPLAALNLARGEVAIARDRLERALSASDSEAPEVVSSFSFGNGPLLALLVDVHLADGSVDEASRAAEKLLKLAYAQPGEYLKAAAALAKGRVCIAADDPDARACLHDALSRFARAQMPLELAHARLEMARALTDENPEAAVSEAKAALGSFERLEAARHADAAAALLRVLGVQARTGAKGSESLTKRETQVLELLGHGLSNPEISDRLYISRKTVEHHVGRILAKLGLRSRAEAAAFAARSAAARSAQ